MATKTIGQRRKENSETKYQNKKKGTVDNIEKAKNELKEKKDKKKESHRKVADMILKEESKNLIPNMQRKIKEIAEQIEQMESNEDKLSVPEIELILSNRSLQNIAVTSLQQELTSEEIIIGLELYRQAIATINKKVKYPPTKMSFCNFMGISSTTYNNYKVNPDKSEAIQLVDDYITNIMFTEAQLGKIKEISTIFGLKSMHGFYEQQAPVVIEHKKSVDIDEIQNQLKELQSQKVIEVDIYEEN